MRARARPPSPSPALLAAVARLRPVPTRRPWRDAALIVLSSLAATALLVAALGLAATGGGALAAAAAIALADAPAAALGAAAAIVLLFAARIVAAVVPPARAVLPRPAAPWLKNLAAIASILAVMMQAHAPPPAAALAAAPSLTLWPCLGRGLVAAALPAAIAAAVLRRLAADRAVRRELTGAAIALAGLVLLVVCGNGDRTHILGAHGSVLVGAPLLAELIAPPLAALMTTAARARAASR
jgi:hypothetical protein